VMRSEVMSSDSFFAIKVKEKIKNIFYQIALLNQNLKSGSFK